MLGIFQSLGKPIWLLDRVEQIPLHILGFMFQPLIDQIVRDSDGYRVCHRKMQNGERFGPYAMLRIRHRGVVPLDMSVVLVRQVLSDRLVQRSWSLQSGAFIGLSLG